MKGKLQRILDNAASDMAGKAIKLPVSKRDSWQSDLLRGAFLAAQAKKRRGFGDRNPEG